MAQYRPKQGGNQFGNYVATLTIKTVATQLIFFRPRYTLDREIDQIASFAAHQISKAMWVWPAATVSESSPPTRWPSRVTRNTILMMRSSCAPLSRMDNLVPWHSGVTAPVALVECVADIFSKRHKVRPLHLVIVDLWRPWKINQGQ